jgi:hypothetical protein
VGTDMENQPAGRHHILTLSRYGRPVEPISQHLGGHLPPLVR